ncbi:MAG: type II toxin-antitoxin system RelE/ParE family toxin [Pseudomonadota bacterium]|jgi:phage-related protein
MPTKILQAAFYASDTGRRPVREWLMELSPEDRKTIGEDIATLEFCWPVGKPKCSPMTGIKGLWEIRSNISSGRIARVFFVLTGNQIVLLHGFVKKAQKTPDKELNLATARMKEVQRYE